jgi:hypothetical protein
VEEGGRKVGGEIGSDNDLLPVRLSSTCTFFAGCWLVGWDFALVFCGSE